MLYIDFAQNKEDFILENEKKLPYFIKNILYFFRKFTGQVITYNIDGRNVVLISKLNKRILKKISKIFKTDVTRNVCICDTLFESELLKKIYM